MTLLRHCDGPGCDRVARNNAADVWLELRVAATEVTEDYCSVDCLMRAHARYMPNLTIGPRL